MNHYRLVHPNIVGFKRALLTERHLVIIMEVCAKATLIDFVVAQTGGVTEQQARVAIVQMLQAVAHAHAQGIVHRDLKARSCRPAATVLLCAV
jgi:serine/threonine protein kinase